MHLTVKEMEILCVFHAGTLSATREALQSAAKSVPQDNPRNADFKSLVGKLSQMQAGESACIAFDVEK